MSTNDRKQHKHSIRTRSAYAMLTVVGLASTALPGPSDTALDSARLLLVPTGWKIASVAAMVVAEGAYVALMLPGPVAYQSDLPTIESPKVPPAWRLRTDFTCYAHMAKDQEITTQGNRSGYVFQSAPTSVQAQLGLPWDLAVEARTSGLNSSLSLKRLLTSETPFTSALRVSATANLDGLGWAVCASGSKTYRANHVLVSPIISPALKKGPVLITPVMVVKDTTPYLFRDNFSPTPFIAANALAVDVPLGVEFAFDRFAFTIYGSYTHFIRTYSQEISNDLAYESIVAYTPRHHFVLGIQSSIYRY